MQSNLAMNFQPLFVRHDLMIELGRLEAAMNEARERPANDALDQLRARSACLNEALQRLPN